MDDLKQEISNMEDRESQLLDQRDRLQAGTLSYNEATNELEKVQSKLGQLREDQERMQKQTTDLEGIKLPLDYNLVFGDPRANEEITNLIRQVKAQLYLEHNTELQAVQATHQQLIAGLNASIDMKQSIIDIGRPDNQRLRDRVAELEAQIPALKADKTDAESKRDAAVTDKEAAEAESKRAAQENLRLNEHIKELDSMLEVYRKQPVNSSGLNLTSSLQPETAAEKALRIEKARVEQINRNLTKYDNIAPLPTKDELIVTSAQLDESFRGVAESEDVVPSNTAGDRVQETAEALEQAEDGSSKLALEKQLYADVTELKRQMSSVLMVLELN